MGADFYPSCKSVRHAQGPSDAEDVMPIGRQLTLGRYSPPCGFYVPRSGPIIAVAKRGTRNPEIVGHPKQSFLHLPEDGED